MPLETVTFETMLEYIKQDVVFNLPLVVVSASSAQLATNTRYYINRPSLVMLDMPTIANPGDKIEITNASNSWQIAQPDGMNIRGLDKITTTGTAGYIKSMQLGESIILECIIANDLWFVKNVAGNPSIY